MLPKAYKNIIVIGLMLSLLAPLLGGGFSFIYRRHQIRREIKGFLKSKLDQTQLVSFDFSNEENKSSVKWKHDKEFEYKGAWYDVIRIQISENSTIYWCWKDAKETQLYQKLNRLTADFFSQNTPLKHQQNRFLNFIKNLFYNNINKINLSDCLILTNQLNSNNFNHYNFLSFPPPFPPPQHF